jgi:hypothetical protein
MPITDSLRETVFATAYDVFLETLRRKSYFGPEKKLMLAVLENGVACFQKYAFARDRKGRLLFQEVEYWVQDTNRDWPFSFANVCDTLGFAPRLFAAGSWPVESREVGEPDKSQDLSATARERVEKESHCGNRRFRHQVNDASRQKGNLLCDADSLSPR